jgi:hypothetical protein
MENVWFCNRLCSAWIAWLLHAGFDFELNIRFHLS